VGLVLAWVLLPDLIAAHEIQDHGSVAMEQHHCGRIAALNVVETYAVTLVNIPAGGFLRPPVWRIRCYR
jgi:hypothetical protein